MKSATLYIRLLQSVEAELGYLSTMGRRCVTSLSLEMPRGYQRGLSKDVSANVYNAFNSSFAVYLPRQLTVDRRIILGHAALDM